MKTMKQLVLLALVLFSVDAFAYKLIKVRDHWGIFGGFSSVESKKESHYDASGTEVIDIIYLNCKGWGDDGCAYMKFAGPTTNGGVLTDASTAVFDEVFAKAEKKIETEGSTNDSFSETHAIQQPDGSYKYFLVSASWNLQTNPDQITVDVQEIDNPLN